MAIQVGDMVHTNQKIGKIYNAHNDRTNIDALESEAARLKNLIPAMESHVSALAAMENRLSLESGDAVYSAQRAMESDRDELSALETVAKSNLLLAKRDLERLTSLGAVASSAAREDAGLRLERAQGEVDAASARLSVLDVRIEALGKGVWLETAGADRPYSRQRADEIALRIADANLEIARSRANLDAISNNIKAAQSQYDASSSRDLSVGQGGVIWRMNTQNGSFVQEGDILFQIADCKARFLETFVPESHADDIIRGDSAYVRFVGESDGFESQVITVMGSGARVDRLTAIFEPEEKGLMRVAVSLPDDPEKFGEFCDLGRMAEVRFTRPGMSGIVDGIDTVMETISSGIRTIAGLTKDQDGNETSDTTAKTE